MTIAYILLISVIVAAAYIWVVYYFLKHRFDKELQLLKTNEKASAQPVVTQSVKSEDNEKLELEKKKLEEKNRKLFQMSETVYKEKKLVDEENAKLLTEKEKLETEKLKVDEKVKKLWSQSTAIHREKERINEIKLEVERKHKEVTDSINYAKRIQVAMLKSEAQVSLHLPKHFVLFRPRDVVSGDFYWSYEKENYWYIAAVDCTGHGVPGAFLTMLGCAFLNEICSSNVLTPAEMLDQLRSKIIKELSGQGEVKDGMDMSICRIDLRSLNDNANGIDVQWAGANNPLWYMQGTDIIEIKADKQPIGYYEKIKPFTNQHIHLTKGGTLYLFTDGYADQFGGPMEKKFKYKPLMELLKSTAELKMDVQKQKLLEAFENWKGYLEQTDDVCIIGIRV